jgi:methylated-DNA-[protein]-cysteine S-methyltransferase
MTRVVHDSPLGELTIVGDGDVLTGLYFRHHWCRPDPATFGPFVESGFEQVRRQLDEYFGGRREEFDLAVRAAGDEFQHRVWAFIKRIPYGATTTYGEIARELGDPALGRDVGAAIGRNPLCIVVPCHRVVGKDGNLTGYAGGLQRKRFLLELEKGDADRLF